MEIVMVSGHGCIRLHKMAIPLIERGHRVHLVAMRRCPFKEQYKTFLLCADVEQMIESLALHAAAGRVDVFHCHNEPSWFVSALKERTDIPIILDVHDSFLARSTPEFADEQMDQGAPHIRVTTEERTNFQLADALVFPGETFRRIVSDEFKLTQPNLVLPSYVPERFYAYKTPNWNGGLVYEGKVNLPEEATGASSGFKYCEYTELSERCNRLGMDFHLYAGRPEKKFCDHYNHGHTFVHKPHTFDNLLTAISRHDWGLVGNVSDTPEWHAAMPNKLFEYLAAGVPVVAMNADSCANLIRGYDIGVVVSGPEELAEKWPLHTEKRKNVIRLRQAFSMNSNIHLLEEFYQRTMEAAK